MTDPATRPDLPNAEQLSLRSIVNHLTERMEAIQTKAEAFPIAVDAIKLLAVLAAPAAEPVPLTLDAAWKEAEAALREVDPTATWMLEVGRRDSINGAVNPHTGYALEAYPEHYFASCGREWTADYHETFGTTPAEALRKLLAALASPDKGEPHE